MGARGTVARRTARRGREFSGTSEASATEPRLHSVEHGDGIAAARDPNVERVALDPVPLPNVRAVDLPNAGDCLESSERDRTDAPPALEEACCPGEARAWHERMFPVRVRLRKMAVSDIPFRREND
jgi:hypothetical protein